MLCQIVINTPLSTMYDLRLAPGRYCAKMTSLSIMTDVVPEGVLYQIESLIFRQLYGSNQYLTVCDDLLLSIHNRTGNWEFDYSGPMSLAVSRVDGGANHLQRMIIYLELDQLGK